MHVMKRVIAIGTSVMFGSWPAHAQGTACRPYDLEHAQLLLDFAQSTAAGTDTMAAGNRAALHIPNVPADFVTLVTDTATCARAALAYERVIRRDSTVSRTHRVVYVVRAGSTYLVLDPDEKGSGEWETAMVFDTKFLNYLAGFTF